MTYRIYWKSILKSILPTLLFYIGAFAMTPVLDKFSPSGPCNPGMGILWLMFLPFVSAILLVVNILVGLARNKPNKAATILHLIVCVSFVTLFLVFG